MRMSLALSIVGGALVLAGVLIEGSQQNPWNLFLCYFFVVASVDALRRRPGVLGYAACVLGTGLAIYGAAWTLGPVHASEPRAALVYVGLTAVCWARFAVNAKTFGAETS